MKSDKRQGEIQPLLENMVEVYEKRMFNQDVDCLESSALKKIERRLTPCCWT